MREWILAGILFGSTVGAVAAKVQAPSPRQMVIRPHLLICGKDVTTPQFVSAFWATPEIVQEVMDMGGGDIYFHSEEGLEHYGKGKGRGICV